MTKNKSIHDKGSCHWTNRFRTTGILAITPLTDMLHKVGNTSNRRSSSRKFSQTKQQLHKHVSPTTH